MGTWDWLSPLVPVPKSPHLTKCFGDRPSATKHLRNAPLRYPRSDLNPTRSSFTKAFGCSQAAK
jgi:hypothetical protein